MKLIFVILVIRKKKPSIWKPPNKNKIEKESWQIRNFGCLFPYINKQVLLQRHPHECFLWTCQSTLPSLKIDSLLIPTLLPSCPFSIPDRKPTSNLVRTSLSLFLYFILMKFSYMGFLVWPALYEFIKISLLVYGCIELLHYSCCFEWSCTILSSFICNFSFSNSLQSALCFPQLLFWWVYAELWFFFPNII